MAASKSDAGANSNPWRDRARGVFALGALLLVVVLSGCAYVNPLVANVPTPRDEADKQTMPQLATAVGEIDGRVSSIESKRDWTVRTARTLDLLTFGFAGSAAYAAIGMHHARAVLNSTIAAGATYTGASLFAPMDVANVYNSGVIGLTCVANRGAALRTAVASGKGRIASDDQAGRLDKLTECSQDANDVANAQVAQDKAKSVLAYAEAADGEEAARVRQAANGVVTALNREVLKRSNNPDVILAAARSLVPRATGMVIEGKSAQPGLSGRSGDACTPEQVQGLRAFTSSYAEIDKAVTAAVNAMATLDTSCVLEPVATEALTLSQEEVTVTKDASVKVTISGGRPPYALTQTGASPDVSVELIAPRTIVITGLSTIKGQAGPFSTQVKDNSVITAPKTLKVSTK